MTTPNPTRREADAWWGSLGPKAQMAVWSGHCRRTDPCHDFERWWRFLPDKRAVTIYQQDNRE